MKDSTARRMGKPNDRVLRYIHEGELLPMEFHVQKVHVLTGNTNGVDRYPCDKYGHWIDDGILAVGSVEGHVTLRLYNRDRWSEVVLMAIKGDEYFEASKIDNYRYMTAEEIEGWEPEA